MWKCTSEVIGQMHVPGDCRELVYEVTTEEFSSVSSGNSQTS